MTNDTLSGYQFRRPVSPSDMPPGLKTRPKPAAGFDPTSVTSGNGIRTNGPDAIATQPLPSPGPNGQTMTASQMSAPEAFEPELDEQPEVMPLPQPAFEPESRQIEQRRRRSQGKRVLMLKMAVGITLLSAIIFCQGLPLDGVTALHHALSMHSLPKHVNTTGLTAVIIGIQWILLEKRIYDMLRIFTKFNDMYLPYVNFVASLVVACYTSAFVAWLIPIFLTR